MQRILIVDDEAAALDALRIRLQRTRCRWHLQFCDNAKAALQAFETEPFDMVVTDIRMPAMDGVELLREVAERWPDTIRIVLTGYQDTAQAMRLVPLAHRYLQKNCDAVELERIMARSLSLRELLDRKELRAAINGIQRLPATPSAFVKLQSALARDDLSTQDVANIVEEDPAITAKVLQLVNSSFFRLARRISNVERAVAYLGFNAIGNLVLSAGVFSLWPRHATQAGLELERRQIELQRVAVCAHALTTGSSIADDTLLAALLQDIGYWILAHGCCSQLETAFQMAAGEGIPEWQAEKRIIGASHAEMGAYLLGLWGLPHSVIEAVAYHHTPAEAGPSGFTPLTALTLARYMAEGSQDSEEVDRYLESIDAPFDRLEAERRVSRYIEWPEPHAVAG